MEELYGSMTVAELKKELKSRNAMTTGRKKDLIERLIYYQKNNNFGNIVKDEIDVRMIVTPNKALYKDVNSSSPMPTLTNAHIKGYIELFDKNIGIANEMYTSKYLHYLRYCLEDKIYYVTSKCSAQMKKNITYQVDVSLALDGEIIESSCECTAGHSTSAHCKHVCVTLLAVKDACANKTYIIKKSSTESLQTFHQPKKRYTGSPVKSNDMHTRQKARKIEINFQEDDDTNYQTYFYNLIKGSSCNNMAIKQLMEPANPFAVYNDHNYSKYDARYHLLKTLFCIDVTLEDIERIERETKQQDKSKAWFEYRMHRITASRFHECCKVESTKQGMNLANSIINPKKFTSKQTTHGHVYEKKALELFRTVFLQSQLSVDSCGLILMKDFPFIGASPDALLAEYTVVEVKCPYTCRYEVVSESNVDFIYVNKSGGFSLKESHRYYAQVQGQMMVTGRLYCDFLIYTFKSVVRISVPRNDIFIAEMLEKLVNFYDTYLKPAILNKYLYRNYDKIF